VKEIWWSLAKVSGEKACWVEKIKRELRIFVFAVEMRGD